MAEKGSKDEIELAVVADLVNACVAEADGLAFAVGSQRDLCGQSQRNADAGAAHPLAEPCARFDPDHDPILDKGKLGVLCIDKAGGLGISLEVVAAVGAAEKLLFQGALQGIAADL